jgi:hypothetical protein
MEKIIFKFQKKTETKSRFKKIEGSDILPETLTISNEDVTPRQDAGIRNVLQKVGNFVGEFRKSDISPYKISPIRPRITGTLFDSKGIFGYSDLGFANEKNQFQRGKDLIVFLKPQNDIFEIWVFKNGWILKDQILQNIARNS